MSKLTDEEIIAKLLRGEDPQIFGKLYDRYSDKVYRKCISFTNDPVIAKDLTHDIFLKVFLRLSQFKGKAKFATWLYSITYNQCVDHVNKKKRMRFQPIEDDLLITDHMDDSHEKILMDLKVERLKTVLEQIRPESKMLLLMKYQDGSSIAEIMQMTEKKESAIKMALKRAKLEAVELYKSKYKEEEID